MNQSSNPYQAPTTTASVSSLGSSQIRLRAYQSLPKVCILCGGESTFQRRITFETHALFGSLRDPEIAMMMPLCSRHKNFRRWWPRGRTVLFLSVILIALTAGRAPVPGAYLWGPLLILLNVGLCLWLYMDSQRIRGAILDENLVLVTGVSPDFVQACQDNQQRHTESLLDMFDVIDE